MAKIRDLSLRSKSIFGVLGLILILSTLNSVTFVLLRSYLASLSGMIDVTVISNDLRSLAGNATEGLPLEIEEFSLHPSELAKVKIYSVFTRIDERVAQLHQLAVEPDVRIQLELVGNMFQSLRGNFVEIAKKVESKAPFAEVNQLIADIKEGSALIGESIQQAISLELSYDQKSKAILEKQADTNGLILILVIALTSVLGFFTFYVYLMKRNILLPLDTMQQTMDQIASDASDIKLRIKIERKDEIGKLAEYFNKMADTIQTYKEGLEDLVEMRTRQLSDTQAMLVQSGKLSALGEMAGGIAHEVNNPLAVIQLKSLQLLDMIEEESLDRQSIKELASSIEKTVNRISKIIKGLRIFSRDATNDAYEMAQVRAVVDDTLALCGEKLRTHGVALRLADISPDLRIECRPTEISQVLLNLIGNAFDVILPQPERWIEVQALDLGAMLEISVTDSGHGIPEEIRQKIFQPFFTTKEIGKGTGLGLSISMGIIQSHQGTLFLDDSCPNTRFVIRLPFVKSAQKS